MVEALVGVLLLLLTLGLAWDVGAATARSASALADRGESLAAARATGWILQEELEGVTAGADLDAPRRDSFSIRAFRGAALVCGLPAPRDLVVRWSGVRAPDPTKDSVALLTPGGWIVRSLAARSSAPGACPTRRGGREERWTLGADAPGALLARFFERGSYHLADGVLRYRIGAGGRQPLTPVGLDSARSGLTTDPSGRVVLTVAARGSRRGMGGPGWTRVFSLPVGP